MTFRILVVDDKDDKRESLVANLEYGRPDCEIVEATNGLTGLAQARQATPDLILLDIEMPVMDGYECLAELKQDTTLRDIPVLIISGRDSREASILRAIESGADDFFSFPVMDDQLPLLLARIDTALKRRAHQKREAKLREDLERLVLKIEEETNKTEALLKAIFPRRAIPELKTTGQIRPTRHEDVAVLFCDVVGFTSFCDDHPPEEVIEPLEMLTEQFEGVVERFGLEKIKMIGDALMAVGGLFAADPEYVLKAVQCGYAMIEATQKLPAKWNLRVGIHVGPVVAGKLGRKKYMYDVWGDTVNTASRIESAGVPGAVVVSQPAWARVAHACQGTSLGLVELKNKPALELFRVDRVVKPVSM